MGLSVEGGLLNSLSFLIIDPLIDFARCDAEAGGNRFDSNTIELLRGLPLLGKDL